jgi:hypothetical protein
VNRRRIAAVGIATAAVVGTAGPSWAFWTLTSDPTSTAGAKADSLVAAHAQAGRNGASGVNAKITIRLGAGIADRFTVYRGPDLVCLDKPANQVCEETGSNNSGDKTYTITQYVGTNWVSSVTTCVFKNNNAVADPSSVNCSPLTNPIAPLSASRTVAPADSTASTSKSAPAPTPIPTPTPTAEPVVTEPAPVEESPAEPTEPASEPTAPSEEPEAAEPAAKPGEEIGAEMGAGAPEPAPANTEPSAEPSSTEQNEQSTETTEGSTAPDP